MTKARKMRRARARRGRKSSSTSSPRGRGPIIDFAETIQDSDASVEDPLLDWPEVEEEKDQWVLERNGERDDSPDS